MLNGTAFLFPGVGAQAPGMAGWLLERSAAAREVFEQADDVLGRDLTALCADPGRGAEIDDLQQAQLAVLTTSFAGARVAEEELGLAPAWCAGYSLGEITALCAAGAMEFADALRLVEARGRALAEWDGDGLMAWVTGLPRADAAAIVGAQRAAGRCVFVAGEDAVDQITISGTRTDVHATAEALEDRGALLYPLPLRGAFHTPLMQDAAAQVERALRGVAFRTPRCPVFANATGAPYPDAAAIAPGLAAQLTGPVRWHTILEALRDASMLWALEPGPKAVLAFLARRTAPDLPVRSLTDAGTLDALAGALAPDETARRAVVERCLGAVVSTRTPPMAADVYDANVRAPYQRIRRLLDCADAEAAVSTLCTALRAKQVSASVRERRLARVLGFHLVRGREAEDSRHDD